MIEEDVTRLVRRALEAGEAPDRLVFVLLELTSALAAALDAAECSTGLKRVAAAFSVHRHGFMRLAQAHSLDAEAFDELSAWADAEPPVNHVRLALFGDGSLQVLHLCIGSETRESSLAAA